MDYLFHSYPKELAKQIVSRWGSDLDAFEMLPPEEALASLLSEAYQASLLREEDRSVICRLILVDPGELSDEVGPPSGLHVLKFREERPMHEDEIRRLSPTATFFRTLIGVRWDSNKGFLIWGIVNSGSRWINQADGGRLHGPVVPDRLIIHIRGPGSLIALRGENRVATLLNGKLQGHGFNIYEASWLVSLQERFAKWILHECFKGNHHTGATIELDFTRILAQNLMRRVISQVRRARHGGMLIIIASPNWDMLVRPDGPICPKYWIEDTKAQRRYRELIFTAVRTLSEIGARHGFHMVGWKEYQKVQDDRLAEVDEAILECAHLMADLMAVDGALVLTAARDIIGFGAEVHVPTRENEIVYRALDIEATQVIAERADNAGTRHRAAYRLARDHPECMITVVSQDGSVRYVGNPNGKVTYWDILSI
jgi:DisA bacterial checkpoint controller nucleotide-binding.